MNGPQRTACFAKEMHSYTLFTLKLYPEVQPEVIPEVQPEIIPYNPVSRSCHTRHELTNRQCSNLRFAPALNEPLRNNQLYERDHWQQ